MNGRRDNFVFLLFSRAQKRNTSVNAYDVSTIFIVVVNYNNSLFASLEIFFLYDEKKRRFLFLRQVPDAEPIFVFCFRKTMSAIVPSIYQNLFSAFENVDFFRRPRITDHEGPRPHPDRRRNQPPSRSCYFPGTLVASPHSITSRIRIFLKTKTNL